KYHILLLLHVLLLCFAQHIWHNTTGFSRVDILFPFSSCCNAIFLHDPFHPIFSHFEQGGKFAMAHRIIFFVPCFNGYCYLLILFCLLPLQIERPSRYSQCSSNLAFCVGAVGLAELVCQLHLLCWFYLLNSPDAFFKISFRTVNSPIIFFKSSGDSPGAYPCDCAFCLGSRFS